MAQIARDLLLHSLNTYPDNTAVECGSDQLSYQQLIAPLIDLENNISEHIHAQSCIGVLADKSLAGYQCIAGAFLFGKTYVPLNVRYPIERNIKIIEQAGVSLLLVDHACRDLATELQAHFADKLDLLILEQSAKTDADSLFSMSYELVIGNKQRPLKADAFEALAYIMFTSGSTGEPKGVPVSDANLEAYLNQINQCFEFLPTDRFSQFFDFTFDLSIHDLLVCWGNGACLCAPDKMAMLMPLQFADKKNLSVWFSVPSLGLTAKDLLRKRFSDFRLESIRYSLFCGEALPQLLADDWSQITQQAPVINLYGPTEATIAFTLHEYKQVVDKDNPVVSIGRPFGANQVTILDDQGRVTDHGELCLGGPQVFSGYWQRDELTEQAFHRISNIDSDEENWYRTGDIVSYDENGALLYHHRNDGQVQVMGFRVELQEVEHVLRELSAEGTIAVIPFPVNDIGEAIGLTAFIGESYGTTDELKAQCENRLPHYMIPGEFIQLSEFPYNASGKLDYNQLKKIAANES